jgi:hypothetical protein
MNQDTVVQFRTPGAIEDGLTEHLRNGAKQLIQQAVEAELPSFWSKIRTAETSGKGS